MSTKVSVKLMIVGLAIVMVAFSGCGKKPPVETGLGEDQAQAPEATSGDGQPDVDLASLLFNKDTGLQIVYFDYDSFALRPDALKTLADNAEKIKNTPDVIIQIEGHCDERGTQEYNLALGEKRALAVREHLIALGISGDRMVTISYGEEKPAAEGHDESAWGQNRRSEFNQAQR